MASFPQFLNSFDPETKGKQFEVFVKWFLKNDPEWSTQVDQIWLWDEYPERWGPDCGIDLVFKHKNSEVWAVQAKCYSQENSITKSDLDTFLSESNRSVIDKRLLIATTDLIGTNAKRTCANQEKDVIHFLYSDLEKAEIEYPEDFSELNKSKRKDPPKPRPHQSEAVDAVEKGFENNDLGQMIMACGTGKTYTTLWVKERIKSQSTLVLVPSLSLLSQTLREWTFASKESFDVLCVCSDETVGKKSGYDPIIQSVHDLPFPVTSDVEEIRNFLQDKGSKVIFSTYHSSPLIAESQSDRKTTMFDLVIADEAHRCTGESGSTFTTVLDHSLIKAKKRLFTTATPKTFTANLKKSAEERGVEISGMDDEDVFGKVFYSLPFGKAIKSKLLTDYQVVIVGVDKPMIAEWIENRELIKTSSGEITDAESLASQIGLIKAIKDYDLKRIISFHSRVKRAESFSLEVQNTIQIISDKHIPKGNIWTDFVSGLMSSDKRNKKLKLLKDLSHGDRGLLSNARCLSEGIDVPSLDGVAFVDPKGSQVDIIQAVGRAIRLSEKKTFGTIFLPVFIKDEDDAEISIHSSNFNPVWNVLNSLKSHDDVLSNDLDQLRTNLGRRHGSGTIKGIPKVIVDLPRTVDESFAESLKTILIEKTTESWNFWCGLLEYFVDEEGHSRVHQHFKTEGGFKLGGWVASQRKNKDSLSKEKIGRLNDLGFIWDPLETDWEEGYSHLEKFYETNGHSRVPRQKTGDGFLFGRWVQRQRSIKDSLSKERIDRLNDLGFIWDPLEDDWEEGYSRLKRFCEVKGHARVPHNQKNGDEFLLGRWVQRQRKRKNSLDKEKIGRLNDLGFIWDPFETDWVESFSRLEKFYEKNGHSSVPARHKTEDGFTLGNWVVRLRKIKDSLSKEKIGRLNDLGFIWDPFETDWVESFSRLEKFYETNGHLRVPARHKTKDGFLLGGWVASQRRYKNSLSQERIDRLNGLGFVWNPLETDKEEGYSHLEKYYETNGHSRVPTRYKTEDGFKLGKWVSYRRNNKDSLSKEKIGRLNDLGFIWDPLETDWEEGYSHLEKFYEANGHSRVNIRHKTKEGFQLGSWVSHRRRYKNSLSQERIDRLNGLGFVWNPLETDKEEGYSHLEKFYEENGHSRVHHMHKTEDGFALGKWVSNRRRNRNSLSKERIDRLNDLGFIWNPFETDWEEGYSHLEKFYESNGHSRVPYNQKTEDEFLLGRWNDRQRRKKDSLSHERIKRLNGLGIIWKVR